MQRFETKGNAFHFAHIAHLVATPIILKLTGPSGESALCKDVDTYPGVVCYSPLFRVRSTPRCRIFR